MADEADPKPEVDDAWERYVADIVVESMATAGGKPKTSNQSREQAIMLFDTVCQDVGELSDRLYKLCGWRFRLRVESEQGLELMIRLLLVDDHQRILESVARIDIVDNSRASMPRLILYPLGTTEGIDLKASEFRGALIHTMIGENGVMRALLNWRLRDQGKPPTVTASCGGYDGIPISDTASIHREIRARIW